MKRLLALSIGLVVASLAAPQSAYACSCLYIADDEDRFASNYENAQLILQGVVTEEYRDFNEYEVEYRVSVEKVWKGRASARMDIHTAYDSAACGIRFLVDESVVIFATEHDGKFHTGLCSGTTSVPEASDLIDWLNTYEADDDDEGVLVEDDELVVDDEEEVDDEDDEDTEEDDEIIEVEDEEVDCSPYICKNGDIHPRCEGGTVINYFVNPCQFSDGEVDDEEEEDDEDDENEKPIDGFKDVDATHPNYNSITFVRKEGIVSGYNTGEYLPGAFINRAEFTKIIVEANFSRSAIDNCKEDLSFTDITKDDWFYKYICMAVKHGILDGYPDNTFRPGSLVNFAEASKIVVNAFSIKIDSGYEGGVWWRPYVLTLAGIGGLPSTFTDPNQSLTRGDMAEIIYRVMMGMS